MICVGASTSLTPSSEYDTSPGLYAYRAYNGNTYQLGKTGKTLSKYHQGDIVRVECDLDKGTIDFKVNGSSKDTPNITGVKGPLYPAVMFYGNNRGIQVLSVEINGSFIIKKASSGPVLPTFTEEEKKVFCLSRGRGVEMDPADNTGKTVRCIASADNSFCFVPVALEKGSGFWDFVITNDVNGEECTNVGACTTINPSSDDYMDNKDLYMYRALNGKTYGAGVEGKVLSPYHPGDIVRVSADLDKGVITFSINGVPQPEPGFGKVVGPLYPCISFYDSDRSGTCMLSY
jgi:hypothetical protein